MCRPGSGGGRKRRKQKKGFFSWLRERQEDDAIWQCSWDVPASDRKQKREEHEPILVFDVGGYHLRAHVAERGGEGEEQSSVLPSCVRRPWTGEGGYLSGTERGAVQNWEEVEDVLVETLENHMPIGIGGLSFSDGVKRFLACASSLRSPSHFARLGEIVFELLGAQQFLSVDQDLLSALAICGCSYPGRVAEEGKEPFADAAVRLCQQMQNFTGVIVDMGSSVSRISPLLSGLAISGIAVELPIGGRDLDLVIRDDLLEQNEAFSSAPARRASDVEKRSDSGAQDRRDCLGTEGSTRWESRDTRRNVVSLTAARQGKERLLYCVEEPAASDLGSNVVLQAEAAFCASHPVSYEVYIHRNARRHSSAAPCGDDAADKEEQAGSPARQSGETHCTCEAVRTHAGERHINFLTASRVLASELFFDEAILANYRRRHHRGGVDRLDGETLPAALLSAVEACPLDLKRELLENIYLVGGSSLIPGFALRLQAEVTRLLRRQKAHSPILPRVHVLPSPLQLHSGVAGGFRFALGPQFDLNHISRHQYEEYGTSFLERFSVRGRLR